jgi:cystathionine beta-lyase/cystathionine gamma-synthase
MSNQKSPVASAIDESLYATETRLIYGKSNSAQWDFSHHVIPPLTTSSSFRLGSAERGAQGFYDVGRSSEGAPIYIYDRLGEPTGNMLQDALATAEGGEIAVTFASGMAAISGALLAVVKAGDEIIAHDTLYGCTYSLLTNWLSRLGCMVKFADLSNPDNLLPLISEKTRVVYLESPVNPTLTMIDPRAIAGILRSVNAGRSSDRKILSLFDNTFATPFGQRPLQHGIDIVVHSLTKGICGFGTELGGAVITSKELYGALCLVRKDFGGILSPASAWHILVYGLSTLSLRVPQQQRNALEVARFLEQHPAVESVCYPGLESFPQAALAREVLRDFDGNFAPGFVVYFRLGGKDPRARGEQLMNCLANNAYCITLAVSLGQLRTLIEHPASMTHSAYLPTDPVGHNLDAGGIRLAVGLERAADIIRDLEMGFAAVG